MVGGDDKKIPLAKLALQLGQSQIKFLQRRCIALRITTIP